MSLLEPCIVFASGTACAGKTSTLKALATRVDNAIHLDRDDINKANLHVSLTTTGELLPFKDYFSSDNVFQSCTRTVRTLFGEKLQIDPKNEFYARHISDQCYMIIGEIARTNLRSGKVVLVDCLVPRQIQDGSLRDFINQDIFDEYQKYFLHFVAPEHVLRQRVLHRAKQDKYASTRVEVRMAQSPDTFHEYVTEDNPIEPTELNKFDHLIVDTTEHTSEQCSEMCIEYILQSP